MIKVWAKKKSSSVNFLFFFFTFHSFLWALKIHLKQTNLISLKVKSLSANKL